MLHTGKDTEADMHTATHTDTDTDTGTDKDTEKDTDADAATGLETDIKLYTDAQSLTATDVAQKQHHWSIFASYDSCQLISIFQVLRHSHQPKDTCTLTVQHVATTDSA